LSLRIDKSKDRRMTEAPESLKERVPDIINEALISDSNPGNVTIKD